MEIKIIKKADCPLWADDIFQGRCYNCEYFQGEDTEFIKCSYPEIENLNNIAVAVRQIASWGMHLVYWQNEKDLLDELGVFSEED